MSKKMAKVVPGQIRKAPKGFYVLALKHVQINLACSIRRSWALAGEKWTIVRECFQSIVISISSSLGHAIFAQSNYRF
jgi:hypothetical protein